MVTLALSLFVGSAMLVALTDTCAGLGTWAGAVYRPEEEIVPTAAVPPATPFTSQVTFLLLVLVTVAVSCWVWETERKPRADRQRRQPPNLLSSVAPRCSRHTLQ